MKIAFSLIVMVHALIHIMGFVKAFKLAPIEQLTLPISKPMGLLWLGAALLFFLTLFLFLTSKTTWWIPGTLAVVLSQVLILMYWPDAKAGTLANLIILLPLIVGFYQNKADSFINRYKTTVTEQLRTVKPTEILTEKDLEPLPRPVQEYLRYVGAIGQPKVHNFSARIAGKMRLKKGNPWVDIQAQQYNFFHPNSRTFYIKSQMYGIPFDGLHRYVGDQATMEIKIASMISVADAHGEKMTAGETVTLFNDMCLLAPATLIDPNIQWTEIDSLTVEATFTNAGHSITAQLFFNKKGELIDFSSDDRFESEDGKTYRQFRWTTPVKNYITVEGRKIPSYGEAIWHHPEGPYKYAEFDIKKVAYNCESFR